MNLSLEEKIVKARISLQAKQPFFAYLVSHMKIGLTSSAKTKTLGVFPSGNIIFNRDYLSRLATPVVATLLCHVCLHIVLNHLRRLGKRERKLWNIASDVVVNNLLVSNEFIFPSNYKVPFNNCFDYKGTKLEKISDKSAEEVYDILVEDENKKSTSNQEQNDEFHRDTHTFENEEKSSSPPTNWKDVLLEAWTHASMRGDSPKGMKRVISETVQSKVSWKTLINEYVQKELVSDWSWERPSKKSLAVGVYLPYTKKENLDVIVTIDTSGSIDQKTLTEFVSEIVAISQSYENIKITVLIGDSAVEEVILVDEKNIDKLRKAEFKGGGGTSHVPFYEWIKKNKSDCRLVINLTDGETKFPKGIVFPTLWVLTKGDVDVPFGRKVVIGGNKHGQYNN